MSHSIENFSVFSAALAAAKSIVEAKSSAGEQVAPGIYYWKMLDLLSGIEAQLQKMRAADEVLDLSEEDYLRSELTCLIPFLIPLLRSGQQDAHADVLREANLALQNIWVPDISPEDPEPNLDLLLGVYLGGLDASSIRTFRDHGISDGESGFHHPAKAPTHEYPV